MSLSDFYIYGGRFNLPPIRIKSIFYTLLVFLCVNIQSHSQNFYLGSNKYLVSSQRYHLSYKNYPASFAATKNSLSVIAGTNFGYHIGYYFNGQMIELTYTQQLYAYFNETLGSGIAYFAPPEMASNFGLKYKYSLLSRPVRFLNYRSRTPFRLMVESGPIFQINRSESSSSTGTFENSTGTIKIISEDFHTDKPQFLFQVGIESEVPLYKDLFLYAGYSWIFGFGQKMITTHYTGVENGVPVDGYRYSDGGGSNFSAGLRWYLPKDTKTPQTPQLVNKKNFYLGVEYYKFIDANNNPNQYGTYDQSIGLIAGYRKKQNVFETGFTPIPSLLYYWTDLPLAGATSNEKRLYIPVRYKRVVSIMGKDKFQNLEWLPSIGFGLHVPLNTAWASSFFPNGDSASDYQIVNPLVLGAELGSELALNFGGFALAFEARYLYGFSYTRMLQVFDNNAQPTDNFISFTPTGWLLGGSIRYRFGK
jgi:hypothetical protein